MNRWSTTTRAQRITALINKTDGCWLWTGYLCPQGYGRYGGVQAHRIVYEMETGETLPAGEPLDHLCRVRNCVNPAHLELVTIAENNRRSFAFNTHCPQGHEYTAANIYWERRSDCPSGRGKRCRTCLKASQVRMRQQRKERLEEARAQLGESA